MAGLGEACSLIAAILFTLDANVQARKSMSCTSMPCSWLPPSFVKALLLFPYFLEKHLAIPTSPFFHLLVHGFSVTCFRTFFVDPLSSFNWWAVSVGGEELKWRQLAHDQLMSQQGPHYSPH